MTEELPSAAVTEIANSAGAMLRQAREAQGMHVAMLAATMKVSPRKIEALEADRVDELPDLAFARALAQTMCRSLKVDPEPILAKMPSLTRPDKLEHTANGMKEPFMERGGGASEADLWAVLRQPAVWATVAILAAAGALMLAPKAWLDKVGSLITGRGTASSAVSQAPMGESSSSKPVIVTQPIIVPATGSGPGAGGTNATQASQALTPPSVGDGAATPMGAAPAMVGPSKDAPSAGATVIETVHSAPQGAVESSGTSPGPGPASPGLTPGVVTPGAQGLLVIRSKAPAWVEVQDASGKSLIARSLQAGESIGIDGSTPFKVRLGAADKTEVRFRGEPVDVVSKSVGNTIRMELK